MRAGDLAALPLKALLARNRDWTTRIDNVIFAAPTRPGNDRDVARMALLLAGLPESVPERHRPPVRFRP